MCCPQDALVGETGLGHGGLCSQQKLPWWFVGCLEHPGGLPGRGVEGSGCWGDGWQPLVPGHGVEGEPGRGRELAGSFCLCDSPSSPFKAQAGPSPWPSPLSSLPGAAGRSRQGIQAHPPLHFRNISVPRGHFFPILGKNTWGQSTTSLSGSSWGHLYSPCLDLASRALPRPTGHPWGARKSSHPYPQQSRG